MSGFLKKLFDRLRSTRTPRKTRGEQLEHRIGDWFEERYQGKPGWNSMGFDGYADAPHEFRILNAHWALEYNISNGGWGQFLWNCRGAWRILLWLAEQGYRELDCPEQVRAVKKLKRLCQENEADCDKYQRLAVEKDDFSYFGAFCERGYGKKWQSAFYDEHGEIRRKRHAWVVANASMIRRALR